MGDRCYCRLYVRPGDEGKVVPHFNDRYKTRPYAGEEIETYGRTALQFDLEEMNYGANDECDDAAKAGCTFVLRHGPGCSYESGTIVCIDGAQYAYAADLDGCALVPCGLRDNKLRVNPRARKHTERALLAEHTFWQGCPEKPQAA